jgi:endonuclease YncB( thermonuclease family)
VPGTLSARYTGAVAPSLPLSLLLALALAPLPGLARAAGPGAVLEGRVVGVADGDTLTLLVERRPVRIRLAQIDAPEIGQPYGRRSKAALSELVFGKPAQVAVVDEDDYGRQVGEVYVAGVHVNFDMVRQGHAWAYTRFARSTEVIDLESDARRAGRGLWRLPESQRDPPWVWRQRGRRSRAERPSSEPRDPACGTRRFCREMASCAEARFHYARCGLRHLDGDGDGVPCESLCR